VFVEPDRAAGLIRSAYSQRTHQVPRRIVTSERVSHVNGTFELFDPIAGESVNSLTAGMGLGGNLWVGHLFNRLMPFGRGPIDGAERQPPYSALARPSQRVWQPTASWRQFIARR
jgi:hypothetical protein